MGKPTNPLSSSPRDAGGLAVAFGSSYFCSREQIACCPKSSPIVFFKKTGMQLRSGSFAVFCL